MPLEKAAVCRRRSSRISALEEKARLVSLQEKTNKGQNGNNSQPSPSTASKKRGRKRKTPVNSVATEEGDESEDEREFFQHDSLPASPSIPEQSILEFILDLLQRRDTQELFAQPVDRTEVEGYYKLVKEPMDFGTMRAKLQEGMYTSLEQFERDVFLISSNAMAFNAPTTMFYQEARTLRESARKVFHDLHTEPEKFRVECSRTRRRTGKKPLVEEAGDSSSKPTRPEDVVNNAHYGRTAMTLTVPFLFSRFSTGRHSGSPSQNSRIGGGPRDADRRMTYQHPTSASKSDQDDDDNMQFSFNPDALRKLVRMPFPPVAYEDSINRFSKDLGPVAQRIAQKKLAELRATRPYERTETPGSVQGPWIPVLADNSPSTLVPQLSRNFVTGRGHWGNQFQSRRPEASREAPDFMSVAPILPNRRSAVNLLPAQYKACHNQVPELSADRRSFERMSSRTPNGLTLALTRSGPPSVDMHTSFYWCGEGQPRQNINNFSARNKGKAVSSDDGKNNFGLLSNTVFNAKRGSSTGVKDRLSSPDENGSVQGRTSHVENVQQLFGILRGDNGYETAPASQSPLHSNFHSPPPTSSSLLASPSEGTWLPFQNESRLDQATRTYLQELRSGNFNAIATSNAALRYPNERSARPVGFVRQVQVREHDPSAVRTMFPLQRPRVAPSKRVPSLNRGGPSGGAASQDCQKQTILSQSFWDMLQPLSLGNNVDRQLGTFDLNL